jgi:hypothetical protein
VIIWVPRTRRYHAYPNFRARRGTDLSATQPADLASQVNEVELGRRQHPR